MPEGHGPRRDAPPPLVLASASPRRAAVLATLGLTHRVDPARVPEEERDGESPAAFVERLAREKAAAVAARHPDALVLAGDTAVVHEGRVVGKPADAADAETILLAMSGGEHAVLTGLALALPAERDGGHGEAPVAGSPDDRVISRVDESRVRLRDFDAATARAYVATGEPLDKAGAYGIQGLGAALVTSVEGDYYTVVGLSVAGLVELLGRAGWRLAFPGLAPVRPGDDPDPLDPHPDAP